MQRHEFGFPECGSDGSDCAGDTNLDARQADPVFAAKTPRNSEGWIRVSVGKICVCCK
jgi:hypothetical protein